MMSVHETCFTVIVLKSHKFFFFVLVAVPESSHVRPHAAEVRRAAVLLPWRLALLEELASGDMCEDPGLHLLHLLLHLCHDPLPLLVDHHQLLQLHLSLLLLQLPVLSAPSGGLVVEVAHPPELLGGGLVLGEVGSCGGGGGVRGDWSDP